MRAAIFIFLLFLSSPSWLCSQREAAIHPQLEAAFGAAPESLQEVLIVMQSSNETLRPLPNHWKKTERGAYVFNHLQRQATMSQAEIRAFLSAADVSFRPFFIVNAIYAKINWLQAQQISRFPKVVELLPNPWVQQDLGFIEREQAQARQVIEWGIERIGATALWELGFKGEGIVVGGQDTGYDFRHPTLVRQYRGTNAQDTLHDYNWHDAIRSLSPLHTGGENPCGLDVSEPCDDHNHGTHTMGTMVGDDEQGNQIGVAPAARWVACRNMERGWGSPASYIECFEWFLAPTRVDGSEADPSQAPHVIANSWACPEVEGCVPENFELMETAIQQLRNAGVVVVTSAGNSGSQGCGSVSTPPSIFAAAYAVGATSISDTIAAFSSRGPVFLGDSTLLQPQVVAPGVNVRSAIRNGGFANFSGTSMAGPHVAGAVALLLSALPGLAGNVDAIERIFRESALPLYSKQDCGIYPGNAHPNGVYGYGRIDLEAAYKLGQVVVNTQETNTNLGVILYPNPAQQRVQIDVSSLAAPCDIALYSVGGQLIQKQIAAPSAQFSLTGLARGIYWVKIQNGQQQVVRKLVLVN